jgi:TRAP-type C4-dicarboxylate transport system substrate-binding protein
MRAVGPIRSRKDVPMTTRSKAMGIATTLFTAFALTLALGRITPRLAAAETLKIGTLAPKASPWGRVFETWVKAVNEKSAGRLEVQFFYNGKQGDEAAMIGKIKSGQLDGAFVTAVGLGKVYKPILALQMPGVFSSWAKLDAARTALNGDFEKGAKDAGFAILGWSDVGRVRLMSKGFAVRVPDDIKGKKPFAWRDDAIQAALLQVLGGVTPVPLNIPEVLPNLNTGAVDIVTGPSLLSEQLQWSGKLDTIQDEVVSYWIGGLVISSKKLDALPADLRAIVIDTGRVAASALTTRIRNEDDAAFGRLKGKMTLVALADAERALWRALFKQVRARLAQGTFDPTLVQRIEDLGK